MSSMALSAAIRGDPIEYPFRLFLLLMILRNFKFLLLSVYYYFIQKL